MSPPANANREAVSTAGEVREGVFVTARGRERLRYRQVGDQRLFEGDIQLPPPVSGEPLEPWLAGAGRTGETWRWPEATVPFDFAPSITAADEALATSAMAMWERTTPVRFTQRAGEISYVRFRSIANGNCNSPVGRQTVMQTVDIAPGCTVGNIAHEIGHAVGLWHEQSRADRGGHVTVNTGCVPAGDAHNFQQYTNGGDYGLYDFDSIMHYGSTFFVPVPLPLNMLGLCPNGLSVFRANTPTGASALIAGQRTALSPIDRQAVEEMYSESFGRAVATGDFDNDGDVDLAVGAPRAGGMGAGHVYVYSSTAGGLVQTADLNMGNAGEDEDRFGYALAVGDFNRDGIDDLAVGSPGRSDGSGRVTVYSGRWGASPLLAQQITQTGLSSNEAGDRFGYALAAGDFDGDNDDDLAVGAPGESWANASRSGAVFRFNGSLVGLSASAMMGQGSIEVTEPGDDFGAALVAADFDDNGMSDLAVGAPNERDGATPQGGLVYLFNGGASFTPAAVLRPQVGGTNYNEDDMLFGFALSAADIDHDGRLELAVGAPGATISGTLWGGRVILFRGATNAQMAGWREIHIDAPITGAAFGYSVAAGRVDTDSYGDLAVGVPGGAPSTNVHSGRVFFYRGSVNGVTLTETIEQDGVFSIDEAGDRFGASVALGNLKFADGGDEIVVGAPGERVGSAVEGRAYTYRWNGSIPVAWQIASP